MTTTPQKTNRKIWMGAAMGFALLLLIASPQRAVAQQWNGPDGSNNISNANSANVGIGLTVPLYKFDVLSGTNVIARFGSTAANNSQVLFDAPSGYNSNLTLQNGGVPKWYLGNRASDNRFSFVNAGGSNEVFSILQGGNVGVGLTAPLTVLHVKSGASGASPINSGSDITVGTLESSAHGYLSILTPNANQSGILFGNVSNNAAGGIIYNNTSTANGLQFRVNGNSTKMAIDSSGNVGIGTTSPEANLSFQPAAYTSSVEGIKFQSSDNATDSIIQALKISAGDMNLIIGANAYVSSAGVNSRFNTSSATAMINVRSSDGFIRFYTNTSTGNPVERMQINSSGNVGIGTTSPGYKLDVNGTVNATGLNINGSPITTSQWSTSGSAINFSGGNVGIGTLAPASILNLQGNGNNDPILATSNNLTIYDNRAYNSTNEGGMITFGGKYNSSGVFDTFGAIQGIKKNTTDGNDDGQLNFYVRTNGDNAWTSTSDVKMVIDSTGSVGIGTTSPTQGKMVVAQSSSATDFANKGIVTSVSSGIATANAINSSLSMYDGTAIHAGDIGFLYSSGGTYKMVMSVNNDTNGDPDNVLTLQGNGGNVGIGTTAPAYKLDVAGEVRSSTGGFRFPDGTVQTTAASGGGGGGAVASVYGRTGAVVAATNDYTWAQIDKTTSSLANLATRSASDLSSGTLPDARFPSTLPAASGANLTAINASNIASGTVPTARLGTGTADAATFLRGDNTWAALTSSQWTTSGSNINYSAAGNVGIGTTSPSSKLDVTGNAHVSGNLTVDGNIAAKYQDMAEWVPTSEQLATATVVVLDASKTNHVISSSQAYDTRVAGVISEQPGIALGESGAGKVLVATTGRVKVKVDASRGPIRIGDLLVTSDVPGMAMKSEPIILGGRSMHMPGTLIGKALEPLEKGKGEILVLLSLQ
jgi:hypothetical protein